MILVISLFVVWFLSFYLFGLYEWSVFVLLTLIALGIGELYAKYKRGMTLSEIFYLEVKKRRRVAILLTSLLFLGFLLILYHLWTLWG